MRRIRGSLLAVALLPCIAGAQNVTADGTCNWPIEFSIFTQAMYSQRPTYPPPEPSLVTPAVSTKYSIRTSPSSPDLVRIAVVSTVDLSEVQRKFPQLVQQSDGWKQFQANLSCENRAYSYEYGLRESGGHLIARVGFIAEKHLCGLINLEGPKARVNSTTVLEASIQGETIGAKVVGTPQVDISTSALQDMVLGILSGGALLRPIGIDLVQTLQTQEFDKIRTVIAEQLRGITLPVGSMPAAPANLRLLLTGARFSTLPDGQIGVIIAGNVVEEQRSSSVCAWVKSNRGR